MAWDEERSRERVEENDFHDFEVDVQDLRRTMDFRKLGTKDVRRADGVHLYIDVPGFHDAVVDAGNDKQKQKKLVRAASVLRKVQRDLVDADDIGDIQRQTVRLHALAYKPYNSDDESKAAERAKSAVIHAITQNTYVIDVFDPVFEEVQFGSAAGLSGGTSFIANIGKHGERELISLGSCANLAAKVLGSTDTIHVTEDVFESLPECLKELFKKSNIVAGMQCYRATGVRWNQFPDLADDLGVSWNEEKWRKKTEQYRDELPLDEIEIADATTLIDLGLLTERNCKRTAAVAIYADLDGFTRYVQEAEDNDKVVSLIRQFHMIRAEFHAIIGGDYEGLVLQHRADGLLAILHMPCGDDNHSQRCRAAVDIAIALQSSMEHVLNEHLKDRKDIHVAVGVDVGKAFVTRLGKKGRRVGICFGPKVTSAEQLQLRSKAKQIRISEQVYDQLDDDFRDEFTLDGDDYVAKGLTFPKLDEKQEEEAARAGSLAAVVQQGHVAVTTKAPTTPGTWYNSRPWGGH